MKYFYRFLSIAFLAIIILAGCHRNGYIVEPGQGNTGGDYIVVLKMDNGDIQSTTPVKDKILSFIKTHNISSDKVIYVYESVLTGFAAALTSEQVAALSNDPNVDYLEKTSRCTWLTQSVIIIFMITRERNPSRLKRQAGEYLMSAAFWIVPLLPGWHGLSIPALIMTTKI